MHVTIAALKNSFFIELKRNGKPKKYKTMVKLFNTRTEGKALSLGIILAT